MSDTVGVLLDMGNVRWARVGGAMGLRRCFDTSPKKARGACRSQNRLSASGYTDAGFIRDFRVSLLYYETQMTERLLPIAMVPHLLSREAAATYCGMSPNLFEEHLAQAAPSVRVGNRNLWDVRALGRQLDQRSGLAQATRPLASGLRLKLKSRPSAPRPGR